MVWSVNETKEDGKVRKINRDELKDKIINDICQIFETGEGHNNKDIIVRDIRTLPEQEEDCYYEP